MPLDPPQLGVSSKSENYGMSWFDSDSPVAKIYAKYSLYASKPRLRRARKLALKRKKALQTEYLRITKVKLGALEDLLLHYQNLKTNVQAKHDNKFVAPAQPPLPLDNKKDLPVPKPKPKPKPKPTYQELNHVPDPNQEEALRRIKRMAEKQRPTPSNIAELLLLESQCNSEELPELIVDCSNKTINIGETVKEFDGEAESSHVNMDKVVGDNGDKGDI